MTEPTTGNPPLISATKLAARWGKHPSTITRMARDGVINPVAKAGSQMTFSMSDVLRVEAGIFPKLRELPNILSLLGLELAELTPTERESLCGVFYSVPYNHRLDGGLLAVYLELGLRLLKAVSRAESMRTIAGAPELAVKVKEMQAVVTSLLPKGVHQNAAIETT